MLLWWGYAFAVAAVLSSGAWVAERFAWTRGLPSRGVWALALLGSGLWPLLAAFRMVPAPLLALSRSTDSGAGATVGAPLSGLSGFADWLVRSTEVGLPWLWAVATVGLVAVAFMAEHGARAACRRGRVARIAGVRVWISSTDGPAAFGLLRPRILLPYWVVSATPGERRLAVVHELSHIRAGDLPLLWGMYALLCAMPWNPAAWWMFGRLQRAVEFDCDRRVVARLRTRRAYGELLVRAAVTRSTGPLLLAPHLLARRSLLRQRIELIGKWERQPTGFSWAVTIPVAACVLAVGVIPVPAIDEPLQQATVTARPGGGVVRRAPVSTYRAVGLPSGTLGLVQPPNKATFVLRDEVPAEAIDAPSGSDAAAGVVRARARR